MISIIVPFYNAAAFLSRCIDSILNQSNPEFELILVNDCSSDESRTIVLEKADNRIVLVDLDINSGVSFARNIGISKAKGEWITFIDSDDYIEPEYLEELAKGVHNDRIELVCCSHIALKYDSNKPQFICSEDRVIDRDSGIIDLFLNTGIQPVVWGKLFNRQIIKDNNLHFDQDIRMSEDIKFLLEYLLKVNNIYLVRKSLYYYVLDNINSAMNEEKSKSVFKEYWLSAWTAYKRMDDLLLMNYSSKSKVYQSFRCSQINIARMKIHMILNFRYQSINTLIYHELTSFIKSNFLYFVKHADCELKRKMMVVICAMSPTLEYNIWRSNHDKL